MNTTTRCARIDARQTHGERVLRWLKRDRRRRQRHADRLAIVACREPTRVRPVTAHDVS